MAYTPATKLPSLALFQWSTVSAPNPRLAAPIDVDDDVLTFTSAPTDYLGAVITGNFLMNCTNESGFTELMYVPAGGMSVDGLTATGVVRGIRISGLDYTTGSSSFADTHEGDAVVGCAVNAVYAAILAGVIQGTIATNGVNLQIGDETDSTVTLTFAGLTDKGFLRRNASTNKVQFSNDGSTWTNIDSVSSSNLVAVSAADTTPGYLYNKQSILGSGSITVTPSIANPAGNEVATYTISSTASDAVVDTPYTAAEDIAIGYRVSKTTTDDTVENLVVSALATAGTESTFSAGAAGFVKATYVAANKVAVVYVTSSVNYIAVGTVEVATKTTTWGTPVSLGAGGGEMGIAYMSDNKVAIIYNDNSGTPVLYARIATISGTVPTLGTASSLGAQGANTLGYCAISVIDTDKLCAAYRGSDTKGYVACATVSGTTIGTWGTPVEFLTTGAGNAVSHLSISKSSTDKAVVFCRNNATSKGKGALVVATGTTLAVNTEVEIDASAPNHFKSAYISDGKIIVAWRGGASTYVQARIASVAGLVLSFPTAALDVNSAIPGDMQLGVVVLDSATSIIAYSEDAAADGKFNKITISGTTLTAGTQNSFKGGNHNVDYTSIAKVNSNKKFIIAYKDGIGTNLGYAECFQEYDNSASMVGFMTATVASGASGYARSKGVIGSQSGLTAGTTYYIGSTGLLSSSNTGAIKVGIAKNVVSLDIDIDKDNGITGVTTATGTDLNVLVGGAASNADTKHTHVTSASGYQATGSITTTTNTDLVITAGFQPTTIILDFGYLTVPGTTNGYYIGRIVYNSTTEKYAAVFRSSAHSAAALSGSDYGVSSNPSADANISSQGADNWSILVTVNAVSSTGFTVRLASTKTGAPAAFNTSFGWIAYK